MKGVLVDSNVILDLFLDDLKLITRDLKRYITYFPTVRVIHPEALT